MMPGALAAPPAPEPAAYSFDLQASKTSYDLFSVWFMNPWKGIAVGDWGTIVKTTNGGSKWSVTQTNKVELYMDVYFTDENTGMIAGTASWGPTADPACSTPAHVMADPDTGELIWNYSALLTTTNGGSTWGKIYACSNFILTSVQYSDFNHILTTGSGPDYHPDGDLWSTATGVTGWKSYDHCGITNDSVMLDANKWWAVGDSMYYTPNAGASWSYSTAPSHMNALSFVSATDGWAVGNAGKIIHTADGGTWTEQASGVSANLYGVQFLDSGEGWAVGDGGVILHTTNGGTSWDQMPSPTSKGLRGMHFIDKHFGWIVGLSGAVIFVHDQPLPVPEAALPVGAIALCGAAAAAASLPAKRRRCRQG